MPGKKSDAPSPWEPVYQRGRDVTERLPHPDGGWIYCRIVDSCEAASPAVGMVYVPSPPEVSVPADPAAFFRSERGRLWWTAGDEEELCRDRYRLTSAGAAWVSEERNPDGTIAYVFELSKADAPRILGYVPAAEEWLVPDDAPTPTVTRLEPDAAVLAVLKAARALAGAVADADLIRQCPDDFSHLYGERAPRAFADLVHAIAALDDEG